MPAQFWQEALEDIGHDSVKQDDWEKRADIHVSSTCVDQYIYIYVLSFYVYSSVFVLYGCICLT